MRCALFSFKTWTTFNDQVRVLLQFLWNGGRKRSSATENVFTGSSMFLHSNYTQHATSNPASESRSWASSDSNPHLFGGLWTGQEPMVAANTVSTVHKHLHDTLTIHFSKWYKKNLYYSPYLPRVEQIWLPRSYREFVITVDTRNVKKWAKYVSQFLDSFIYSQIYGFWFASEPISTLWTSGTKCGFMKQTW